MQICADLASALTRSHLIVQKWNLRPLTAAVLFLLALRYVNHFKLLGMSGFVPGPGAKHHSVEVIHYPDEAYNADYTVANEQDIVRSLSFITRLETCVCDTIHRNRNHNMRCPQHKLMDKEAYAVPTGRIFRVEGDVEVADSRDGLPDGQPEESVESGVEVAAAVGKVEVEADEEEGGRGGGHVGGQDGQMGQDKILVG